MSECRLCKKPHETYMVYGVCFDCIHRLILQEEDAKTAEKKFKQHLNELIQVLDGRRD